MKDISYECLTCKNKHKLGSKYFKKYENEVRCLTCNSSENVIKHEIEIRDVKACNCEKHYNCCDCGGNGCGCGGCWSCNACEDCLNDE